MIPEFGLEYLQCDLEVLVFLGLSDGDAEWVNEHGNDRERHAECISHVESEPDDDEGVEEDPDTRHDHGEWIVVRVVSRKRRRYSDVLGMGQWHFDDVPEHGAD